MSLFLPSYPEWHKDAACASIGNDFWFPEHREQGVEAKRICLACPVAVDCLRYALENEEPEGIWGGFGPRQRQKMRRGEVVINHVQPRKRRERKTYTCGYCQQQFDPPTAQTKYCGVGCRNAANQRRRKQREYEEFKKGAA